MQSHKQSFVLSLNFIEHILDDVLVNFDPGGERFRLNLLPAQGRRLLTNKRLILNRTSSVTVSIQVLQLLLLFMLLELLLGCQ